MGLQSAHIIKDAGNLPLAKDLAGLIYHQRAQSNEFLLSAATGTSFFTIAGSEVSASNFLSKNRLLDRMD